MKTIDTRRAQQTKKREMKSSRSSTSNTEENSRDGATNKRCAWIVTFAEKKIARDSNERVECEIKESRYLLRLVN